MRICGTLLCLGLLLAAPARAEEIVPEALVFVEVDVEPIAAFVGQPIHVTLRVGYDAAHFARNAVPLFRQPMDVPLQVRAPWARLGDAVEALPPEAATGPVASFALGDAVVDGQRVEDVVRGTRAYRVLEVRRRFLPTQAGGLALEPPVVRFAYATAFEADFLGDRTAIDPRTITVRGEVPPVMIGVPPAEGRPAGYTGAIGRFALQAEVDRQAVAVGETFHLTVRITGDGPLGAFGAPRLDALEGFHVYGRVEDLTADARTIRYEIAAVRAVDALPSVAFVTFHPGPPARYETVRSEPIPLRVRGAEVPGASGRQPPSAPQPSPFGILLAVALLLGVLLLIGRLLPRTPAPAPTAQADAPRRPGTALLALRAAVEDGETDLAAPFAAVVAERLGCPPAAAIRADLATALERAGVERTLAAETAALLEALVAARYGAPDVRVARAEVRSVAEGLTEPTR